MDAAAIKSQTMFWAARETDDRPNHEWIVIIMNQGHKKCNLDRTPGTMIDLQCIANGEIAYFCFCLTCHILEVDCVFYDSIYSY